MIKAQDHGERTEVDIQGNLPQLMLELAQLIHGLSKGIPRPLLESAVKMGFEYDEDDDDELEVKKKDELEDKKEIVKELLQRMREANKEQIKNNDDENE